MIASLVLAAALAAPAPLSRQDVAACLGTADFATNLETLAKARSEVPDATWRDACRAAREANARRRSTLRVLFATGRAPTPGFASTTSLLARARDAKDPAVRALYERAAHDQAARESNQPLEKSGFAPGASPLVLRLVEAISSGDALRADAESRRWLQTTVSTRGWFTISRDGEHADHAAWLIAQHADADPQAQRALIAIMEPLAATGETNPRRFAFLYDRWARGAGQPQRYGVMGECVGAGVWRPRPIEDADALDARRRQAGLPPMAEHQAEQARACR